MYITLDAIRSQFDAGTFARGQDYARKGKVLGLRVQGDKLLAEVGGSGGAVYQQSIRRRDGRGGVRIEGRCSCPVAANCKHVVAVLLTAIALQDAPVPPPPRPQAGAANGLSAATELWLRQVALLNEVLRGAAAAPGAPDAPAFRLAFVLVPDESGDQLELHMCKARLDKRGDLVGVSLQDDVGQLLQAPWVPREDQPLVRMTAALRAGRFRDMRPAGPLGFRLLTDLCAQGRLYFVADTARFQHARLHEVVPGPQYEAHPAWRPSADDPDVIGLSWCFADNEAIDYLLSTEPMCYLDGGEDAMVLGALSLPAHLAAIPPEALLAMTLQAPDVAPHERAAVAARLAENGLDRILPLPQALQTRRRADIVPVPCLLLDGKLEKLRGGGRWHDYAQVNFSYDGLVVDAVDAPVLRRRAGEDVELVERQPAAERAAFETLAGLGFTLPAPGSPLDDMPWLLQLPTPERWLAFARTEVPRLVAAGWQVDTGPGYRYEILAPQDWYAELAEEGEGGDGWFALELGILVDGERHALLPLLVQMIRSAPHDYDAAALAGWEDDHDLIVELPAGVRVVLPAQRIKPILATLGELYFTERLGAALRLPWLDAARLAELEQAAQLRWMGGERLRDLGRKLHAFGGMREVAAPAGLRAQLRPYQLTGLAWMQFLREYGFGGILADDMGLGKTIQTLAHVLAEKEAGRLDAPALVVAPTSLMGNWQAEAARFAPGLRVLLLHGKDRKDAFDQVADADLVLTTYPLLGRDEDALRRHRYHLLILDEAQYIKNHRSKAAQTACLLDARHRLCLTGTPVQNHLGELWSQFNFLMPGLLGDDKTFRARYRKPIEQDGDVLRKDLLARRLKPFLLRRTKDKVATELPPKTEIVLHVDFGSAQRDLYESVRVAMDERVRDEIDRRGVARSQIVILDALLKLRQVCCDPRLFQPASTAGSAKLDALLELLDTLLSEGRKVLVFSQFTSMLALVEQALRARGVAYALLTGDTEDRAATVAAFQQGEVPVFLVSLKAGGVGLNLTAADTVIHYDPWWNPAAENQATDRAWRIGQGQPVFVYKLIARGTLEEMIQDMQRRKAALADALLAPEGGLAEAIRPDDLRALFAPS
ncbi:DEAD/DEAH box helicase [uncultured Massilia sp.]|uniref:DEAD/DEAH box helicase n=1 Tax=uncultured Massilia sp. TaxID=169973 RepID=UPI0025FDBD0C|nr:DEAD/DEAH box helicase [uncultured Massilia sp.]